MDGAPPVPVPGASSLACRGASAMWPLICSLTAVIGPLRARRAVRTALHDREAVEVAEPPGHVGIGGELGVYECFGLAHLAHVRPAKQEGHRCLDDLAAGPAVPARERNRDAHARPAPSSPASCTARSPTS